MIKVIIRKDGKPRCLVTVGVKRGEESMIIEGLLIAAGVAKILLEKEWR